MAGVVVAVAIGSSLGDRHAHIEFARQGLGRLLEHPVFSAAIETAPVDVQGEQTPFLNGAAVGESALDPRELLTALHALEDARGRVRPHPNAPRTLDLDLILYGDRVIDEPGLIVPHARFRERRFVLEPLAAIAGELIDPVTGRTIGQLLRSLPG